MVFISTSYSQTKQLFITFSDSVQISSLPIKSYKKNLDRNIILKNEIDSISDLLSKQGFINHTYKEFSTDTIYKVVFDLKNKISVIQIIDTKTIPLKELSVKWITNTNSIVYIPFTKSEAFLLALTDFYEKKGFAFSKVKFEPISIKNDTLITQLKTETSTKRTIDGLVLKGYTEFSKNYLYNLLLLNKNGEFSTSKINSAYNSIQTIPFLAQIKKPEVLFTNDSTFLYLYLKKQPISTFDGLIGFSNSTSNKLKLTGNLNLYLVNTLNRGEIFSLQWQSVANKNKNLDLQLYLPYIFNSRVSPEISFSLFQQDSSYINTTSQFTLNYNLTYKTTLNFHYENQKSETTSLATLENQDYKKNLFGTSIGFNINRYQTGFKPGFSFFSKILYGQKNSFEQKHNQTNLKVNLSYLYSLSKKSALFLQTLNEILQGKNLLNNELLRVGGYNSIRGFDEQSILTNKYSIFSIEYILNLTDETKLYSISDFGLFNQHLQNTTEKLYSLGLGYKFFLNNSKIDISYVLGNNFSNPFSTNNGKVHLKIAFKI